MTAPNDDPVKHKVESDHHSWEDVHMKERKEFESGHSFIYLNEQHCPEKYEYEAFYHESYVEESGVFPGESRRRLVETHNQEVDKGKIESPVRQVALLFSFVHILRRANINFRTYKQL